MQKNKSMKSSTEGQLPNDQLSKPRGRQCLALHARCIIQLHYNNEQGEETYSYFI